MLLKNRMSEKDKSIKQDKEEESQNREINDPPLRKIKKSLFLPHPYLTNWTLFMVFAGLAVSTVLIIGAGKCRQCFSAKQESKNKISESLTKTYWVYIKGFFTHHWDLLWAHEYPFREGLLQTKFQNLKPHQKINHFPGNGFLMHKASLATNGSDYIPPAFKLPQDKEKLYEYARTHPNVSFVQKNDHHKGIRIISIKSDELNKTGTFLQVFVDKPLLVDGYKFDIGIYTLISSLNPLRVYIYNGEALVKYCKEKYYPFDPSNLDKYVVVDPYLPTWEVPALYHYHNHLGFGLKDTFNSYLRDQGIDSSIIWSQTEDIIRTTLLAKEPEIVNFFEQLNYTKVNFFEMVRFDFLVDEDLKVFLMEVNMSPNLWSEDWAFNQMLYPQVLYNFFSLVGIGERIHRNSLEIRSKEEEEIIVSEKHLLTYPEKCISEQCKTSCVSPGCQLCKPCLTPEIQEDLATAFKEHLHKGDCKRIFPPTMSKEEASKPVEGNYSTTNELHYKWFKGKCLLDSSWC